MELLILFEAYRLALRALVVLMGAHFILGAVEFLRQRKASLPHPKLPATWPKVTVQLPIRNEYYAAARVIEAAAALDYPRDQLQIQVLDDSEDDTSDVVEELVARLRNRGINIEQRRRFTPVGYKAGALRDGLLFASGELIAIFDADFIPSRDFLKRTVPYFSDPSVGMVQGRWGHRNRNASWFTRLQAQILDGLMVVEQTAKSRAGLPVQFNGTAGLWRRVAIEQAGGWTFDSLTEDLDMSMRAQFCGWRLVHLPDVAVPSELPTSLGLFRVQQRRWALGTAQLLRKRLLDVLRSSLGRAAKLSLVFQLARHLVAPLIVVMVLTVPLTSFALVIPLIEYGVVNTFIFLFFTFAVCFQHAVAARALGRSAIEGALLAPLLIPLAIGLAPTYTVALGYGLRDRAGAFHRTPKITRRPARGEPSYRANRSVLVVAEIMAGFFFAALVCLALAREQLVDAAFLSLLSVSFLWVGFGSLIVAPGTWSEAGGVGEPDERAAREPELADASEQSSKTPQGTANR